MNLIYHFKEDKVEPRHGVSISTPPDNMTTEGVVLRGTVFLSRSSETTAVISKVFRYEDDSLSKIMDSSTKEDIYSLLSRFRIMLQKRIDTWRLYDIRLPALAFSIVDNDPVVEWIFDSFRASFFYFALDRSITCMTTRKLGDGKAIERFDIEIDNQNIQSTLDHIITTAISISR